MRHRRSSLIPIVRIILYSLSFVTELDYLDTL